MLDSVKTAHPKPSYFDWKFSTKVHFRAGILNQVLGRLKRKWNPDVIVGTRIEYSWFWQAVFEAEIVVWGSYV